MAFSSKLCNPTPFDVKLPWDRGVNIKVLAFDATELSMAQMDDFRPGKPGSADVKSVLDYHGLFLLDSDRPYDNQALEALQRAYSSKKAQYDSAVRNITDRRAASGVSPNPEALEETLRQMGYEELGRKIQVLKEAAAKFREVVGDQPERTQRQQLDPKRTVFVIDPPREFPSVAAMEFFLDQNADIRAKHLAFAAQMDGAADAQSTPVATVSQFIAETNAQEQI